MGKVLTAKQVKKKNDRLQRVKRTVIQAAIVALVAVYPTFTIASDWGALKAALPSLGFTALMAVVTDIYNRVKPA